MGSWDEICFICGISPESQRSSLYYFSDADELIKKMVSSILEGKLLDLKEKEVESIVKELLMLCRKSPDKWFDVVDEWVAFQEYKDKYPLAGSYWPPNASYYGDGRNANWEGWNPIAIGTFCDKGFPTHASVGDKVISPGGSEVVTRLVAEYSSHGGWYKIIDPVQGEISGNTITWNSSTNMFCCVGPFRYLEAWLDLSSLPPRSIAFPLGPTTMSFAGELYEIVNTRKMRRNYGGFLPSIEYGGIEKILEQWTGPFSRAWTSAKHLTKALSSGLRGPDLIPALFDDFLVWQEAPPDIWSHRSDEAATRMQAGTVRTVLAKETTFHKLPRELLDQILYDLPLFDAINFISISNSIIHYFNRPVMIRHQLRRRITLPLGSLHWLLPVSTVKGEENRFLKAVKSWFPLSQEDPLITIFDPSFPLLEFVRANYRTSSMKNRRRLWDISQQFRALWIQYRTEGYEENIFNFGVGPEGLVFT